MSAALDSFEPIDSVLSETLTPTRAVDQPPALDPPSPDSKMLERVGRSFSRAYGHFSVMMDPSFTIIWASDTLEPIFGWSDAVGRNVINLVHPDDVELALAGVEYHAKAATAYADFDPTWLPEYSTIRLAHADGSWVLTEVAIFNQMEDPQLGTLLGIGRRGQDRTDLARSIDLLGSGASIEQVLPVIARLMDCTFDGCRTQIMWWDNGREVIEIAPEASPLPVAPEDLISTARLTGEIQQLTDRRDNDGFQAVWAVPVTAPGRGDVVGCLVIWCRADLELIIGPQQPVHQAVRLASLAIVDHHSKAALRWEATHDPLTTLHNRAGFAAQVTGSNAASALLFIDLDDFKPINDRLGHEAGDAVLVEVGRRIVSAVRPIDRVARLGGDEFAVLCPELADERTAVGIARRVIDVVSRPISIGGEPVSVGASIGVALGSGPSDRSSLVRRADEAMYRAKAAGTCQVAVAVAPTVANY